MLIENWNVKYIRKRIEKIIDWMNRVSKDILCLKEKKVKDDSWKVENLEKLGY